MGKSAGREKDVCKNGKIVADRQLTSFLPLAFFYFYFFLGQEIMSPKVALNSISS